MAVNINVPSQVKTYANLAAFPATGALKTIYIAEDTNKTYRWTGSVYTEISASAAMTWGAIGGTLSNQTDLQSALDAKVPTTRTLTINGVTQDLSANRTFTISTGITIGSTAIASGVVGRVLFEGAGNVVQESANITWDNTNLLFALGSTATRIFNFRPEDTTGAYGNSCSIRGGNGNGRLDFYSASNITEVRDNIILLTSVGGPSIQVGVSSISLNVASSTRLQVAPTTGNVLIGTTTDAGFRLDVNGTTRVQNDLTITKNVNGVTAVTASNTTSASGAQSIFSATSNGGTITLGKVSNVYTPYKIIGINDGFIYNSVGGDIAILNDATTGRIKFTAGSVSTAQMTLFTTGNFAINTTTDAGYRLDVNGTARFVGNTFVNTGSSTTSGLSIGDTLTASLMTYYSGGLYFKVLNTNAMVLSSGASGGLVVGTAGAQNTASARLQVDSTTQGFLPPRMTTTQKNAIASPAAGLMVYDTTLNVISYYNGTMWI